MTIATTVGDGVTVSAEENPTAQRIRDDLLAEPRLAGADLVVKLHDLNVHISGTVLTPEQHDVAMIIVGRCAGCDQIEDAIEVAGEESYFCEA
jgi:osmotically-inducible protein OsmY